MERDLGHPYRLSTTVLSDTALGDSLVNKAAHPACQPAMLPAPSIV